MNEAKEVTLYDMDFQARPDVWESLLEQLKLPSDTTMIDINIEVNEFNN